MKKFALAPVLALTMAASAWSAPLLGSSLKFEYFDQGLSGSPYPNADNGIYQVGDGVEIARIADLAGTMDLSADRIVVYFPYNGTFGGSSGSFNGWVLSDVYAAVDAFSSVSINLAETTLTNLDAVRLSFDADTITVDWKGLVFGSGEQLVLDVRTASIPVPEPGSLPLVLAALLGIALVRRPE